MSRSKRSDSIQGLAMEWCEVTPPDLESDSEPEVEEEPEQEIESEPEPEPQPEPEVESEEEDPDKNEFFQEVDSPHIVPLALGNQDFALAMKRVEITADNYIWSVDIITDEGDTPSECSCAFSDTRGRACITFSDNPM